MPDFYGADVRHTHGAAEAETEESEIVGATAGAGGGKDVDIIRICGRILVGIFVDGSGMCTFGGESGARQIRHGNAPFKDSKVQGVKDNPKQTNKGPYYYFSILCDICQ